ncbi:hypothetical protein N9190_01160, partial [bacterium]|nr:hypothetical protein [bacterium]
PIDAVFLELLDVVVPPPELISATAVATNRVVTKIALICKLNVCFELNFAATDQYQKMGDRLSKEM